MSNTECTVANHRLRCELAE